MGTGTWIRRSDKNSFLQVPEQPYLSLKIVLLLAGGYEGIAWPPEVLTKLNFFLFDLLPHRGKSCSKGRNPENIQPLQFTSDFKIKTLKQLSPKVLGHKLVHLCYSQVYPHTPQNTRQNKKLLWQSWTGFSDQRVSQTSHNPKECVGSSQKGNMFFLLEIDNATGYKLLFLLIKLSNHS